jgi:hypothetical protein
MIEIVDLATARPSAKAGSHGLYSVSESHAWLDHSMPYGVAQGPSCKVHGAMNAVNPERNIYRCLMCHVAAFAIRDD